MNRNADLKQEIINSQKLQLPLGDKVAEPIPTIEVNPKIVKDGFSLGATSASTGTITIYSSNLGTLNNSFNLNQIVLTLVKDATCDMATGTINVTAVINGKSTIIAYVPIITLTAQQIILVIPFKNALKIDKSTQVTLGGSFTVGTCARTILLQGVINNDN